MYSLSLLAMEMKENKWSPEDGPKEELASKISEVLYSKAEMLDDYFSLQIDQESKLVAIPLLLGTQSQQSIVVNHFLFLFFFVRCFFLFV